MIKGWQRTWFYYKDVPMSTCGTSLPPFSPESLEKPPKKNIKLTNTKRLDVELMIPILLGVKRQGLAGQELLAVCTSCHIQPLQDWEREMVTSQVLDDPIRVSPKVVSKDELETKLTRITMERDVILAVRNVHPYDTKNLPTTV